MNLRDSALTIFRAALAAADPRAAIHRVVTREANVLRVEACVYDLARVRRIYVIGFGKASAAMGQAVEEICGDRIGRGAINVKYGHVVPLKQIALCESGHPLPDENGLLGTRNILDVLDDTRAYDLVFCLISGGGSALLEMPVDGITLEDLRNTTDVLIRSGATINEINAVRKHLSQVKGGQLALRSNAPIVSLILSDVLGSPLDTIASGPTAPDASCFSDAWNVIERRAIHDKLPPQVLRHLQRGVSGLVAETPKADDPVFARVQNVVVADNSIACDAAAKTARELGFNTVMLSTTLEGEAREVAKDFAARALQLGPRPACLIAGGETTVTVRGDGKGGRCQEFALAAAIEIAGRENVLVLAAGTDGTDGVPEAAGAVADGETVTRAEALGLIPQTSLLENDAYHFFRPLGDLVVTGPTNTNVNDVMIGLAK